MTSTAGALTPPSHSWPVSIAQFAVASAGEAVGLCGWYYYARIDPQPFVAFSILWVGFIIERMVVVKWLRLPRYVITPAGNLGNVKILISLVTLAEIVVWWLWIIVAEAGGLMLSLPVIAVGIHLVHAYEVALIKRHSFTVELKDKGVILITALEALGGIFALRCAPDQLIRGAEIMLAALVLEHIFQVLGLKHEEAAAKRQAAAAMA